MYQDTELTTPGRVPDALVIDATRRWNAARARGKPVQPELHSLLGPAGYEMLAPAFDSLLQLCEACAGCPVATPDGERLLCRLLGNPALLDGAGPRCASEGVSQAFACALRSVSILVCKSPERSASESAKAAP